jgi:nifR3 family TIM-barrel protein
MEQANPTRTAQPPARLREPFTLGGVSIPSRFFLAPLAGYTSLAFRLTVREQGGLGLATTDLVNARSLLEKRRRALELAETVAEDRPLAIQLYGHLPEEMTAAARRVVEIGASVVDINMGCPVRKVVRTGGGSALLCDSAASSRLVAAVVEAVAPVPVTVKMRLGWDAESHSAPDLARAFERAGAAGVIIHGRTRAQGFSGAVDLEGIARVVDAVSRIPVVGNGDLRSIADVERMLRVTGCAAVSIGRGALANPCFIAQLASWAEGKPATHEPSFAHRVEVCRRHFARLLERRGEHYACLQFRKILKWYDHWIRPQRELWRRLLNLTTAELFERTIEEVLDAGPRPHVGAHEPRVPVPAGPIDKW